VGKSDYACCRKDKEQTSTGQRRGNDPCRESYLHARLKTESRSWKNRGPSPDRTEPGSGADVLQRPLRSHFRTRLTASVRPQTQNALQQRPSVLCKVDLPLK